MVCWQPDALRIGGMRKGQVGDCLACGVQGKTDRFPQEGVEICPFFGVVVFLPNQNGRSLKGKPVFFDPANGDSLGCKASGIVLFLNLF